MWWKKPKIVYIDTRILILKILVVFLIIALSFSYWRWTRVTEIRFISTELASTWVVHDHKLINEICRGFKQLTPVRKKVYPSGIRVRISSMKEVREYLITDNGLILEMKSGRGFVTSDIIRKIDDLAEKELKHRSPFGEMLNWKSVKDIIPVGQQLVIKDLDSGLKFNAIRTGGYSHADVEPVTKSDTLVIKKIYGGNLSWKRKAVVAELQGRKIAASFTGATDGNGEIKDNDIPGKMNLYFYEAEKDGGRNLSHEVTIWKAAGKTRHQLKELTPEKTIMVLFTAIDQQDIKTLDVVADKADKRKLEKLIGVTVRQITKTGIFKYNVTVTVNLKSGPYNERRVVNLSMYKDKSEGRFIVDGRFLDNLLK